MRVFTSFEKNNNLGNASLHSLQCKQINKSYYPLLTKHVFSQQKIKKSLREVSKRTITSKLHVSNQRYCIFQIPFHLITKTRSQTPIKIAIISNSP